MSPILRAEGLEKSYHLGRKVTVPAVRGMDLQISRADFCAIVGPSGSGKTTLLNLIGLLDHPDSGEVWIQDMPTAKLAEPQRAVLRRHSIGFIFQTFNLLGHLTAEENVALPMRYAEVSRVRYAPSELLKRVGLGHRLKHRPEELSGGEQQRVAIARALLLDPPIILADEPTGDLDSETAEQITELLEDLRSEGKTLIVVTHNADLAAKASRTVRVRDGQIVQDPKKRKTTRRKSTSSKS